MDDRDPRAAVGIGGVADARVSQQVRGELDAPHVAPDAEFARGCVNRADVYYPSNHGPWPVIVTIHGRPRTQRDMAEIARALAARGAVVYNVDYRGVRPAYTKGFPEAITDVACAVRFARSTAQRYGGDGDDVVLVGHSQGGYVGTMVALAGDTFRTDRAACRSRRPTA